MEQTQELNPTVQLSLIVQQIFKEPMTSKVLSHKRVSKKKTSVIVEITIPNGETFIGEGNNQREARRNASKIALAKYK